MAERACGSFPATRSRDFLAPLDAADRHVRQHSRVRGARPLGEVRVLRNFENAFAQRLHYVARLRKEQPVHAGLGLWHHVGLDDTNPWPPLDGREIRRHFLHLGFSEMAGDLNHFIGVRLPGIRAAPCAVSECLQLLKDVGGG